MEIGWPETVKPRKAKKKKKRNQFERWVGGPPLLSNKQPVQYRTSIIDLKQRVGLFCWMTGGGG